MTHKELRTMLKQFNEYQLKQISQAAMRFLALNQELAEIEPDVCPCCGDQNAAFIRKGVQCGRQRFQCKSCGRKFTYDTKQLTSTPINPRNPGLLCWKTRCLWHRWILPLKRSAFLPLHCLPYASQAAGVYGRNCDKLCAVGGSDRGRRDIYDRVSERHKGHAQEAQKTRRNLWKKGACQTNRCAFALPLTATIT